MRVKIEHEYLGGIKYGYVGLGLAEGVRRQIERLAGILRGLETVEWLCLRLERLGCVSARRRNGDSSKLESVLDGLRILENTRVVKLEGDVTPDIVKEFEWLLARKGSRVSGRSSDNLEHVRTSVGDRRDPFTIDIR